jgi:hypothetical protein
MGTGDCGNDAIEAAIPIKMPELVTWSLFGAGIAGMAATQKKPAA